MYTYCLCTCTCTVSNFNVCSKPNNLPGQCFWFNNGLYVKVLMVSFHLIFTKGSGLPLVPLPVVFLLWPINCHPITSKRT